MIPIIINSQKCGQFGINLCSHSFIHETGKRWASKYFLTTPIFYVNADPHIGHLYTAVIGDASVRFQKLKNPNIETKFMVGTDEHGLKVFQSAKGKDVQKFCDNTSAKYRNVFNIFSIAPDDFVRTTEGRHRRAVEALWTKISSKDLFYKDKYSGWYCLPDEMFVSETMLKPEVDKNGFRYTIDGNKPAEFTEEVNYKFRLSNFQKDLMNWIQGDVIQPKVFKNQLYKWIETWMVVDMSVSRPSGRVPWGIPVPGDPSQTIYVWMDALASYLCSNGFPDSSFKWPPDYQLIGKDILRFHGLFWPAFLIAADLEPPKCLFCHSHWLMNNEKMSKSKGNVVDPIQLANKYTSDGFRYFLLREGVPHDDGNFEEKKVMDILNSELADSIGNLLNRCTGKLVNKNQVFPVMSEADHQKFGGEAAENLINVLKELPEIVEKHFEDLHFYMGINAVIAAIHMTNQFFHTQEPWKLCKDPTKLDHLNSVLHLAMESLRVCGILLQPIIPNISNSLLNKLSVGKDKRSLKDIRPFSWELSEESKPVDLMPDKIIVFPKLKSVS